MDPTPVTFTLANEKFTLNTGVADEVRRETHYRDGSMPLSEEEKRILTSLGIDESMESVLQPYMPEFFKALPKCHTDASLRLNNACEVPYYVLWSTAFANREYTNKRIEQNKKDHASRNLLTMAQDGALIDEMHPVVTEKDLYTALFTLIRAIPVAPTAQGALNPAVPISAAPNSTPEPSAPPAEQPAEQPAPSAPPANTTHESYTRLFTLIPTRNQGNE